MPEFYTTVSCSLDRLNPRKSVAGCWHCRPLWNKVSYFALRCAKCGTLLITDQHVLPFYASGKNKPSDHIAAGYETFACQDLCDTLLTSQLCRLFSPKRFFRCSSVLTSVSVSKSGFANSLSASMPLHHTGCQPSAAINVSRKTR